LIVAMLALPMAPLPSHLKTFGTGRSAFTLGSTEQVVFEHTVAAGVGVMTHFWITGSPALGAGTDNATVRYYVDGEVEASIQFKPSLAAGVGYDDDAVWGTAKVGHGSNKGGWFMNMKIPFGSSIRVSLMLPGGRDAMCFVIVRGCENLPITVGSLTLPSSARLHLQRIEQRVFEPLAYVPIVDLPSGAGLVYMLTIAASSRSYNFWEGCYRMFTPYSEPFPGTVLSTGMEDFFDSAYGFAAGPYRFQTSGCTHRVVSEADADGLHAASVSAYRFFEEDPLVFEGGVQLQWRIGDYVNRKAHPESPKCYIDAPGPGDTVVGVVLNTTVTSYAWLYTW